MFTGIIDEVARVSLRDPLSGRLGIVLSKKIIFKKGESVAINGCCLTMVAQKSRSLEFDLSEETLDKTNLKFLKSGDKINLERAMKASDRFGGHFVLGHVDGLGKIVKISRTKGSLQVEVGYPKQLSRYLIDKGSIAVDGISLTLSLLPKNGFKVFIIPHTERHTNLGDRKVGDLVNLEVDVLGKYVEKLNGPTITQ